jgi:AcrR family transcriptional regulator
MPRAGLTADRLTRAAAELADEIGFDALTVSAVARRFGVRDASLYAHLAGAHDLRVRVAALALTELADEAAAALAGRAGRDALLAFAGAYRDYATRHPGRYAATRVPVEPDSAAGAAAARHATLSRALLRGYRLPEPAETDAVRLLGSTFHGYVSLEATGAFGHQPRPSDESWTAVLDALHAALTHWPPPGGAR